MFDTFVETERLKAEGADVDDFAPPMEDDVTPVRETARVDVPLTQNVVLEGTPLPHPSPAVEAKVVRPEAPRPTGRCLALRYAPSVTHEAAARRKTTQRTELVASLVVQQPKFPLTITRPSMPLNCLRF